MLFQYYIDQYYILDEYKTIKNFVSINPKNENIMVQYKLFKSTAKALHLSQETLQDFVGQLNERIKNQSTSSTLK